MSPMPLSATNAAPFCLLYPADSLTERLQATLCRTHVVKTLKTMLALVMSNPSMLSGSPTVSMSGDDADAKETVSSLLVSMGWKPRPWQYRDRARSGSRDAASDRVMKAIGFKPFAISPVC